MAFESPILRNHTSGWNPLRLNPQFPRLRAALVWRDGLECENPDCRYRHSLRRFLRRSANDGVVLQGHWYCSLDCFERVVTDQFSALLKLRDEPLARGHRVPIGLLLLGRGAITGDQLKSALAVQRDTGGGRLGRCLVDLGAISAQEVSKALAAQWGCGVFPLEGDQRYRDCFQMLPFALLETARMVPVHYHGGSQMLFVGFAEDIDHTALYAVERLLGARTEPCVVTEAALERALGEIRGNSRPDEIVFETLWEAEEMARTVRDYALALGADELLLARPRRFLWVRLRASGRSHDILFRLPISPDQHKAS